MARRPPLKIAKTPASEHPEHEDVRIRDESSARQQEELRAERAQPARPAKPDGREPENPPPKQAAPQVTAPDVEPKPVPAYATSEKRTAPQAAPGRASVRVLIGEATGQRIRTFARAIGKDERYVLSAVMKASRLAVLQCQKAGTLGPLLSQAQSLLSQREEGATRAHQQKLESGVVAALDAVLRPHINDPLRTVPATVVAGAIVGAQLMKTLAAVEKAHGVS